MAFALVLRCQRIFINVQHTFLYLFAEKTFENTQLTGNNLMRRYRNYNFNEEIERDTRNRNLR